MWQDKRKNNLAHYPITFQIITELVIWIILVSVVPNNKIPEINPQIIVFLTEIALNWSFPPFRS